MRKRKKWPFKKRKQLLNRDIVVQGSAFDYYRTIYHSKTLVDFLVELYDGISYAASELEKKYNKDRSTETVKIKCKLSNLKNKFDITAYIDIRYDEPITIILITVKGVSFKVNCKKIEEELTERFLRGG
jgi:hypothetical protein